MLACSHRAYERLGLPLDAVIASYDRLLTAVLCLPVAVLSKWLNESSWFLPTLCYEKILGYLQISLN